MEQTVPLSVAPVGVRLLLVAPEAADRRPGHHGAGRRRLAQLGLRPGAELVVIMRTSGGGRVVAVSGSRIALDRATAQRLRVTLPEQVGQTAGEPAQSTSALAG